MSRRLRQLIRRRHLRAEEPISASMDALACGCSCVVYWRKDGNTILIESIDTHHCPTHQEKS